MDQKVRYIDVAKPMTDGQLGRVRSIEGVAWAVPLYKGSLQAKLENGMNEAVVMYGLDDPTLVGGPAVMVAGKLSDLRRSEAVIVDTARAKDKPGYICPDGGPTPFR